MKSSFHPIKLLLLGAAFSMVSCSSGESSSSSNNSSLSEESSIISSSEVVEGSSSVSSPTSVEDSSPSTSVPSSIDSDPSGESSSSSSSTSIPSEPDSSEDTDKIHKFVIQNSEHITLTVLDRSGLPVGEGTNGNTYYVRVSITDSSLYGINTLQFSYLKEGNSVETVINIINKKGSGEFKNDYFFQVYSTSAAATPYTITVTEKSMIAYGESSFVGTYLYQSLFTYAAKDFTTFDSQKYVTINAAGEISRSWVDGIDAQISEVCDNRLISVDGYLTKDWYIADRLLFGTTDSNRSPLETTCNDYFIGIQKQSPSDSDSLYSVATETFTIDDTRYFSMTATRDGVPYASAFAAHTGNKNTAYFLPNVTFNILEGSLVTDTQLLYEVKNGENIVAVVGTTGDAGPSNRVFVTGHYGEYEVGDKSLFLDGVSRATYDGGSYAYTETETSIVLTAGLTKVTFSVDEEGNITYVSTEELAGYDFHGQTYLGQWTYDGGSYSFYAAFDETENTFETSAGNYANILNVPSFSIRYLNGSTSAYSYAPSSYTYDEETFTLTAYIIDCQKDDPGWAFSMVFDPLQNTWLVTSGNTDCIKIHGVTLSAVE
ncbi:MAG: hypothetical protein SPG64_02310 [Candidatus Enteromonas sp.]|nr:hypothetical protein [Candidatus Enteromonas sp.]